MSAAKSFSLVKFSFDYRVVFALALSVGVYLWVVKRQAAQALHAVNPLNNHNVFAQAADGVVASLSGGESKTTGSAWFKHCQARDFAPWYCPSP